jgi:short-subunit dehydrogenase
LVARRGRIAVLSSVSGFAPLVHRTAYAASKHGLHGFFDSLRVETAGTGLSITIACPSFVRTGIEERAAHRAEGTSGAWSTTGRIISPERLAAHVVSGMLARKRIVLPTMTARMAWTVSRLSPRLYDRLMRRRIAAT